MSRLALFFMVLFYAVAASADTYSVAEFSGKAVICEKSDKGVVWSGKEGKKRFKSNKKKFKKYKIAVKRYRGKDQKKFKKFQKKLKGIKKRRKFCKEHFAKEEGDDSAKGVLRAYCSSCHMGQHASWAEYQTDQDWLAASAGNGDKLITPGDPDNSHIITRMSFYGASNSNMPLTNQNQNQDLTEEQYQTIRAWIESLTGPGYDPNLSCEEQSGLLLPKIRRLSQLQIQNSITDVFGDVFDPSVWPALEDGARLVGMNIMADGLNVNNINFERLYDASRSIVSTVMLNHPQIAQCAANSSSACVDSLLTSLALRLWRRPITVQEAADMATEFAVFTNNTDKLELMLNSLILSSNFLFRKELGVLDGSSRELSNYELISILSFALWNSVPDQTLLFLATQVEPLTTTQVREQIERMLQSPEAKSALVEMYKDYLKLELVLSREKDPSYNFNSSVRQDLLDSAEQMIGDGIDSASSFMQVFGGTNFYINDNTEEFFNTDVTNSQLQSVPLNGSERDGMLNHPAFLAVHSTLDQSGIVKRGVFTLEQVLCQQIPDPPADISGIEPPQPLDPATTSERELLQQTHSSQPSCQGCHASIDPAGFGYENFDAVGRYRLTEKQNVPIDASGTLDTVGAHVLTYQNSAEYSRELVSSPQMNSCVSMRFLEHFFGQILDLSSCEVKKFQERLGSGASVNDLIYNFVLLESFRRRANQ